LSEESMGRRLHELISSCLVDCGSSSPWPATGNQSKASNTPDNIRPILIPELIELPNNRSWHEAVLGGSSQKAHDKSIEEICLYEYPKTRQFIQSKFHMIVMELKQNYCAL
jgi:hypothetical protein